MKELANQTSKATEEISNHISGIQTSSQEAVVAISKISEPWPRWMNTPIPSRWPFEQQGSATHEISSNVQQASQGTSEVSERMASVSSSVADTHQSAENVLSSSRNASPTGPAATRSYRELPEGHSGRLIAAHRTIKTKKTRCRLNSAPGLLIEISTSTLSQR